ncbi:MAG: hypothetical protein RI885_2785 [Actinomycetota bacterium]
MTARNTFVRSLHDLGLATWFGGSLMGAVGLNGASALAKDKSERLAISSAGWARWAPVQVGALVAHAVGGAGLIAGNKGRLLVQPETRANTIVKLVLTLAAAGTTAYSGLLGTRIADRAAEGGDGVTEPSRDASDGLASAQRQMRILQWVTPVLTGVVVILAAQQGEQQRPLAGFLSGVVGRARRS